MFHAIPKELEAAPIPVESKHSSRNARRSASRGDSSDRKRYSSGSAGKRHSVRRSDRKSTLKSGSSPGQNGDVELGDDERNLSRSEYSVIENVSDYQSAGNLQVTTR